MEYSVKLPHGVRARFIDTVDEVVADEHFLTVATGHFTGDGVMLERDHFPGRPIMMGALQIEGMAEAAIQIVQVMSEFADCQFVLTGVDDAIFRMPIKSTEKEPVKEIIYRAAVFFAPDNKSGWACCSTTVRGRLTSRGFLSFMIVQGKS